MHQPLLGVSLLILILVCVEEMLVLTWAVLMLSSLVFTSGCGVTGGSSFSSITSGITSGLSVTWGFCTGSNPDMGGRDGGFNTSCLGVVFRISGLSSFVFFYLIDVTLYFLSHICYHLPII